VTLSCNSDIFSLVQCLGECLLGISGGGVQANVPFHTKGIIFEDLFLMKGRRPLTHHISSITIITKMHMNKFTVQVTKPHRTSISC